MMSPKVRLFICLGVGLVTLAAAWLLERPSAKSRATPVNSAAPADKRHELIALEQELEKKPDHPPILMRMAQLARETGHLDQAAAHLQRLLQNEPQNVEARLELGRVLYEKGDVDGAIQQTRQILASNPRHVDALYNLGAIYGNLGNREQAREYWKQAMAAQPNSESGRSAREALGRLGQN
jgi:Flp pilus assembly protein TadD